MKCTPRQRIYLAIASFVILYDLVVASLLKPSFALTMNGDAVVCVLLLLAILTIRENLHVSARVLATFWRVFALGLTVMLLSQAFWFYFDWRRLTASPSPLLGDALFLLAHVFFFSALAIRPHSASSGPDLRIRGLDFTLLSLWWLFLYAYFAVPWLALLGDLDRYNLDYTVIVTLETLLIVAAFGILALRKRAAWRMFYLFLTGAFLLFAVGNLLMNTWLFKSYYPGGLYDVPFLLALYFFTLLGCFGSALQPQEDTLVNRELLVNVWIARFAMLVLLSLPLMALWSLQSQRVPRVIEIFRLRLVFASMCILGGLIYWKLSLLTRELVRLVTLTRGSIEHLKSVQQQVSHSEKFVALGRLAAGAAHEISNPLTAILGYSELLADIPSLAPQDRSHAEAIREQVHRAQAAVASLRGNMTANSLHPSLRVDKKTLS
jgi:signal transduction histidine kinase